jgi:hypothetical protein
MKVDKKKFDLVLAKMIVSGPIKNAEIKSPRPKRKIAAKKSPSR